MAVIVAGEGEKPQALKRWRKALGTLARSATFALAITAASFKRAHLEKSFRGLGRLGLPAKKHPEVYSLGLGLSLALGLGLQLCCCSVRV